MQSNVQADAGVAGGSFNLLARLWRLGRRSEGDDSDLLRRLQSDPPEGWRLFLDRYSGLLLAMIRDLGFDHDESMDRFVYVCEKLAAGDCRRLRQIRHLGERGEIVPWLRRTVQNLLIDWAWSSDGRPRLFKAIEALDGLTQEVFRLHYWQGLTASAVAEALRAHGRAVTTIEVYEALDRVHRSLDDAGRWRLVSRLRSRQRPQSIDSESGAHRPLHSPTVDPETMALNAEEKRQLDSALEQLRPRDRLLIRLRYDDWLEPSEMADMLGETPATIRRQLHRAMQRLRSTMMTMSADGKIAAIR